MNTTTIVMTAQQLLEMPDNGFRHELVEGELRTMVPTGGWHGDVALQIGSVLRRHVAEHHLGKTYGAETGFVLTRNPDTVRAPDVAFVSSERVVDTPGFLPGAPDLAVEVTSPSDRFSEVQEKAFSWLRAGCRLVLVADPEQEMVTAYRSPTDIRVYSGDGIVDCDDVVAGWRERNSLFFE